MKKETFRKTTAACIVAAMAVAPMSAMATEAAADGLDLKITAGVDGDESAQQIAQILGSSFISLAAGGTEDGGTMNATVNMMGQDLFKLVAGTVGDKLALALPGIDENMYTISLEKVQELVGSAMEGNGSLGALSSVQAPDIDTDKLAALGESYMEPITNTMSESITPDEGPVVLTHIGKELDGVNMTWTPTGDEVAALLEEYADKIEGDKELEEVIGQFVDYAEELEAQGVADFSSTMVAEVDEEAVEGLDEEEAAAQDSIEDLRNFCETAPEALRKTAESFKGQYPDGVATLTIGLAGEEQDLAKIELNTTLSENAEEEISYCFEIDPEGEFHYVFGQGAETYGIDCKSTKAENGEYEGTFAILASDAELATGSYTWNTNNATRLGVPEGNVTINALGVTVTFEAAPNAAGDEHTFSVDGIGQFTGDAFTSAFLKLTSSDLAEALTAPSGTEVDVTDYSEEQFQELGQTLATEIGEYVQSIFG